VRSTVRYCIHCGQEIGDALFCPNLACGRLPNFYRDVPGPGHGRDEASAARQAAPAVSEAADRMTFPIEAAPVAVLRSLSQPGTEHPLLPGATEIGARPPAKIVIDRPEMSSKHARIECRAAEGGGFEATVVDQRSTNGTFVNGKRVQSQALKDGDRVRFANIEFEFRLREAEKPRVTMGI